MSADTDLMRTVYDRRGRLVDVSAVVSQSLRVGGEALIGQLPPFPWWPEDHHDLLMALFKLAVGDDARVFEGMEVILPLSTPTDQIESFACHFKKLPGGDTAIITKLLRPDAADALVRNAIDLLNESLNPSLESSEDHATSEKTASLSTRERTVLKLFLRGDRVKDISKSLHISVHTARNHRKSIFQKLGVQSHVELMTKLSSNIDVFPNHVE